ncbi:hypothetical protein DPMN_034503 [Dreissena polymorpha]|uniref:Uncharacterized protein n=2 Tax=Dreissena polymorpha TaxID=45954 RepID=A0A9D4RJU1_DREPO|nr:hypothetical protein DPMN_034503 [Dreissena polymorpha]
MMYPGHYMPMPIYPGPYHQPYPYMGPMLYRPHHQMYPPGVVGKTAARGAIPKPQGVQKPKIPVHQPSLPVQRDDDDRTVSPKQDHHKAGIPVTLSSTPPKKSAATVKIGGLKYAPRVPVMHPGVSMYPPVVGYMPYMIHPEDPRYLAAMGMQPIAPYYYSYPSVPRHAYPYMVPQAVPIPIPTAPAGSGSVSPASLPDSTRRRTSASSPTGSNHSDTLSASPSSSGSSHLHAQHIQLLPNVVHIPSHLLYQQTTSASSSRSQTPVLSSSPSQSSLQPQPAGLSKDSPRNSLGEIEFPRRRQHSGPRPVSQSPSYSSQSSHESSSSPVLNGDQTSKSSDIKLEVGQTTSSKTAHRHLKLNTTVAAMNTGFSHMFRDELGTPTEVTKLVRMIDEEEPVDTMDDEEFESHQGDFLFGQEVMLQTKPSPPFGRLYLSLPAVHGDPRHAQSLDLRAGPHMYEDEEFDPSQIEPQTPMTPAGFQTPGVDFSGDPLEILRNLTINNDSLNRSAHGHF